jgi:hypothetical protein
VPGQKIILPMMKLRTQTTVTDTFPTGGEEDPIVHINMIAGGDPGEEGAIN